ncbi:hypothetical protein [Schumannella sp. 10F1B-5-1]|uniref:hypothetical protein n=1 Tax=Schumannella sp. 10F1B-5-1 TaxID=2590780 RepID=UPI0011328BE6|nr:hypothetical protein [Schumannella sp. 10F1B-5-1]TPW73450.1 hypothetical protein FJ658_04450 [Schumannella sp. 10F1B-5-1]
MTTMTTPTTLVFARPKRSLLITGITALVLALVPVTVALVVLRDDWLPTVIVEVVAIATCVSLGLRQLTIHTRLTETELSGNGIFSPMVRVDLDDVHEVLVVPIFIGAAPDPVQQLLVRDENGRRLFRLRGNFWEDGLLERIAAAMPVPVQVVAEPIPAKLFFSTYPGSEYWFENKPWLRVAAILGAGLLALGVAAGAMLTLGGEQMFGR